MFNSMSNVSHNNLVNKYNLSTQPLKFSFHILKITDLKDYDSKHFFLINLDEVIYLNDNLVKNLFAKN